jgi:hypothetical protein
LCDVFIFLKQISLRGESIETVEGNLTPVQKEEAENVCRHGREVEKLALSGGEKFEGDHAYWSFVKFCACTSMRS